MTDTLETREDIELALLVDLALITDEDRKVLKAADLAKLDDSDFAYITSDGEKKLPIHDEAHIRAALARFNQTQFDTPADKTSAAKKIVAAAKKFDIEVDPGSPVGQSAGLKESKAADPDTEDRADCPTCDGTGKIMDGHRKCPDCNGTGVKSETKSRKPRHGRDLALQTKCRRQYIGDIEVRKGIKDASTGADLVELNGQVIGYGTSYEVHDRAGSFFETIHPGACRDLLASPDLDACFLVGHDASLVPLARTGAKASLNLTETDAGLQVRALVDPRMAGAQELLLGLENGTIRKMSVGMQVDPADDHWSGEDANGLPDVRDIYRLSNIFDVSAVAFPANPDTALELASARMEEFGPEVTARMQHVESVLKEGRKGTISQADSDAMLAVFRRLFAGEERNAPTAQDSKVAGHLAAVGQAIHDTIAAQVKDPDNNSDPKDKKILSGLKDLQAAHANLMHLQAQDGTPDADDGPAGDDGTLGLGDGNAPGLGSQDGTGSRDVARLVQIDQDLMRLRRPPVRVA